MSAQKSSAKMKDKRKPQPKSSPTRSVKAKPKSHSSLDTTPLEPVLDIHNGQTALELFERGLTSRTNHSGVISIPLLARRCLDISTTDINPEEIMNKLNEVTHIRLDREGITSIDNLELFGARIRNLHLQHNSIRLIEGLDTLTGLRCLTLTHNDITRVENLLCLKRLGLLDLSHNKITQLDADELPPTLSVLSLEGNQCQHEDHYRASVLGRCPQLCQLDGERLTVEEKRLAGHEVTSESEESEPEDENSSPNQRQPFGVDVIGVFDDLSANLFMRCQSRIQQVYNEHKERMGDLESIKSAGGIHTDERGSASNSRISGPLDSPDTTDSSRPPTGSTCMSPMSVDMDLSLSNDND